MNLASSRQKLRGQTLTLERLNDEHNNLSWEAVVALLLCHTLVDDKETALYYRMLRIWVYMLKPPAAYACDGAMLTCKLSVFPIY